MEMYKYKFPLQKDSLCLVFRALPVSTDSQSSLAQSNPYAKEAYFGVARSGPLHLLGSTCREREATAVSLYRV